jgi:hypothetical protein
MDGRPPPGVISLSPRSMHGAPPARRTRPSGSSARWKARDVPQLEDPDRIELRLHKRRYTIQHAAQCRAMRHPDLSEWSPDVSNTELTPLALTTPLSF